MAPNKRPRFPAFSRVAKGKEPLVGSCPSSDDDETQDPNAESPYRPAFEENDTLSHSQFEKGFTMPPLHRVGTWDGRMRHNVLGPPPSYPFQSEVKTNCHHLPPVTYMHLYAHPHLVLTRNGHNHRSLGRERSALLVCCKNSNFLLNCVVHV